MFPDRVERPAIITINAALAMLADPRFGEAIGQLLTVLYASVTRDADRQECFVCLQPWAPDRAPVMVGAVELIAQPERPDIMMFAVCEGCCGDPAALSAALKRDFGDFKWISPEAGTA